MEARKDGFLITTDKAKLDIDLIHDLLRESYWAAGIPLAVVRQSIQHSLCFGMYDAEVQIGFARVITDYTTFGYLADVFVVDAYRGRGLGKWLIATILGHPELQGFRRWMLATRDAHGLYSPFGFAAVKTPERLMERLDMDIYKR